MALGAVSRRVALGIGSAVSGVLVAPALTACGATTGAPEAKSAAPVTLLMLTERTAADLDAQKELFGRFTKEQPQVTFELSPNGPNQAARDRVKVMAQAGTPPDFWETNRAAFGDMLLLNMIAPITDYVRKDKLPFEKMFVPDHVDHITVQGK